jgi:DNA-binding transcriptional ArsR family regulator
MLATNITHRPSDRIDRVLRALAHPGRRALIERLRREPAPVTALAGALAMSLPTISKHLKALEAAGLVTRAIEGRVHRCSLNPEPLRDVAEWLEVYRGFWEGQLDALARHLDDAADE